MVDSKKCIDCRFEHYSGLGAPCFNCASNDAKPNFKPKGYDVVENPQHYCEGAHECIDVMENLFGTNAVIDFCKCNIFKYRFRATKKNGEEDISKAEWYETKLMELIAKRNTDDWIDIF